MTLQSIGSLTASLAHGQAIDGKAAEMLSQHSARTIADLGRLGLTMPRILELIDQTKIRYLACLNLCESPIEQVMLAGLAFMVVPGSDCFPPAIHDVQSGDPWPNRPVVIAPQFNIARYRLDFLVHIKTDTGLVQIAVECDGRAHHTEIKDRIRDNDRDSYLEALGIRTIRYSGSWIYKNSHAVADEIAVMVAENVKAAA